MRNFFTVLIALFLFSISGYSQNLTTNVGKFGLGVNIGGSYVQGDVRPVKYSDNTDMRTGLGFGFTADYWFIKNQKSFFGLGLRARYLNATSRGLGITPNYDIANYDVLNGTANPLVDYSSDDYVYDNFEMDYNEGSLELLLSANKLRANTGVLLYGFGGIGIYKSHTTTNLQDDVFGNYNYSLIDSSASSADIAGQLSNLLDDSYESNAEGNNSSISNWDPTLGFGIGYDFGPVSLALEHKISYLRQDYADGIVGNNDFLFTPNNDIHHYTNFGLIFHIGGGDKNEFTYTDPIKEEVVEHQEIVETTPTETIAPPKVDITKPATNPYQTSNSSLSVVAKVLNVESKSQIKVTLNSANTPFTYNNSSNLVIIPTTLNLGSNEVIITATNIAGSDSDKQIIIYSKPGNTTVNSPTVSITTPSNDPHSQTDNEAMVTAKVKYVNGKNEIFVKVNNQNFTGFEYNDQTQMIFMNIVLNPGQNKVEVAVMNSAGSDQDATIIILTGTAPIVTITSPAQDPHTTESSMITVKADILNVYSKDDIKVTVNGQVKTNFNYSLSTKKFSLVFPLNDGTNEINIFGTNMYGSDNDNHTIIKKVEEVIVVPCDKPVIQYINPNVNPYSTTNTSIGVRATVIGVSNKNQITVKVNGVNVPNFTYNTSSLLVFANVNFNAKTNNIVITATNDCGITSKSTKVIYKEEVVEEVIVPCDKPVIKFINPGENPYNSANNSIGIRATVNGVTGKNKIQVKVNNVNVPNFTYNSSSHLVFANLNLTAKTNTIMIMATNDCGQEVKMTKVIYIQESVDVQGTNNTGTGTNVDNTKPNGTATEVNTTINDNTSDNGIKVNPPKVDILNANPQMVSLPNVKVSAKVLNVTSKNQIVFKINGQVKTKFTYNQSTKKLEYNATLKDGNNLVVIAATNSAGTDSDMGKIIYQGCQDPKIILITPNKPSLTHNGANPYLFKVKLENVPAKSNILKFNLNDDPFTQFQYNAKTGYLTASLPLSHVWNKINISVKNKCGTDSKEIKVLYRPQNSDGNGANPSIIFAKPLKGFPTTVATSSMVIEAKINHVTKKSDIEVWVNGSKKSNFTFNASSKAFKITVSGLKMGDNKIRIKAINGNGILNETYILKRGSTTNSSSGGRG